MFAKRFFYVCAGLLCLAGGVVHAQTAPANVRDGCVTGSIDAGGLTVDVDLLTVPDGMNFVLTDVQYSSSSLPGGPSVVDETGALRWLRFGDGGSGNRSWATGIRFTAGEVVRMRLGGNSILPSSYTICWAGYVSPSHTTSVVGDDGEPLGLRIGPNPTGSGATISFRLDRSGPVALGIYDARGRLVRQLKSGPMLPGDQQVWWDGRDRRGQSVGSGVYFARLETVHDRRTARIVRTK